MGENKGLRALRGVGSKGLDPMKLGLSEGTFQDGGAEGGGLSGIQFFEFSSPFFIFSFRTPAKCVRFRQFDSTLSAMPVILLPASAPRRVRKGEAVPTSYLYSL